MIKQPESIEGSYLRATSLFSNDGQIADVILPEIVKYRKAVELKNNSLLADATRRTVRALMANEVGFLDDVISWVKEPKAYFIKELKKAL